jgi:glycosyltransferase involved in cell wall biosynthesis
VPLLDSLQQQSLETIVIDDGSGLDTQQVLDSLARQHPGLILLRNVSNQGKGAATMRGMREAWARGFTHGLQFDADGQHDAADLAGFLDEAKAHPDAVICGRPVYDETVPPARLYGRYITHVLVWLETLSFQIEDSMCGFRVYPLSPVMELIEQGACGARMEFDTEILVRLFRRGVPVRFRPTRVIYPAGGTSNFRMVRDNLRMAWLHTRLLMSLPMYLARRLLGRRGRS